MSQDRMIFHTFPMEEKFVRLPHEIVRNKALSFKARGVLALLLSNSSEWQTYAGWIQEQGTEGREAVQGAIQELEAAGHMRYRDLPRESGKFTVAAWEVHAMPVPAERMTNRTKWREKQAGEISKKPSLEKNSHQREAVNGSPATANRERQTVNGFPATKNDQREERSIEETQKEEGASLAPPDLFEPSKPEKPTLEAPEVLPDFPAATMVRIWNECVPGSKIQALAGQRKVLAGARWKQLGKSIAEWTLFCQRVGQSPFLTGQEQSRSKRTFTASFDWCILPGNFLKIQENRYPPKSESKPKAEKPYDW